MSRQKTPPTKKRNQLMVTASATPGSSKRPKGFNAMNAFEVAENILQNHVQESKGLFISEDQLAIRGPIRECNVRDSISLIKTEKNSKYKKTKTH